ncbi:hypothetical protein BC828DRAFT_239062 [Blastocladiella britannica]|nr:hypothetical protein BC828DRAFT_239062 [Blastocladiella britannica]
MVLSSDDEGDNDISTCVNNDNENTLIGQPMMGDSGSEWIFGSPHCGDEDEDHMQITNNDTSTDQLAHLSPEMVIISQRPDTQAMEYHGRADVNADVVPKTATAGPAAPSAGGPQPLRWRAPLHPMDVDACDAFEQLVVYGDDDGVAAPALLSPTAVVVATPDDDAAAAVTNARAIAELRVAAHRLRPTGTVPAGVVTATSGPAATIGTPVVASAAPLLSTVLGGRRSGRRSGPHPALSIANVDDLVLGKSATGSSLRSHDMPAVSTVSPSHGLMPPPQQQPSDVAITNTTPLRAADLASELSPAQGPSAGANPPSSLLVRASEQRVHPRGSPNGELASTSLLCCVRLANIDTNTTAPSISTIDKINNINTRSSVTTATSMSAGATASQLSSRSAVVGPLDSSSSNNGGAIAKRPPPLVLATPLNRGAKKKTVVALASTVTTTPSPYFMTSAFKPLARPSTSSAATPLAPAFVPVSAAARLTGLATVPARPMAVGFAKVTPSHSPAVTSVPKVPSPSAIAKVIKTTPPPPAIAKVAKVTSPTITCIDKVRSPSAAAIVAKTPSPVIVKTVVPSSPTRSPVPVTAQRVAQSPATKVAAPSVVAPTSPVAAAITSVDSARSPVATTASISPTRSPPTMMEPHRHWVAESVVVPSSQSSKKRARAPNAQAGDDQPLAKRLRTSSRSPAAHVVAAPEAVDSMDVTPSKVAISRAAPMSPHSPAAVDVAVAMVVAVTPSKDVVPRAISVSPSPMRTGSGQGQEAAAATASSSNDQHGNDPDSDSPTPRRRTRPAKKAVPIATPTVARRSRHVVTAAPNADNESSTSSDDDSVPVRRQTRASASGPKATRLSRRAPRLPRRLSTAPTVSPVAAASTLAMVADVVTAAAAPVIVTKMPTLPAAPAPTMATHAVAAIMTPTPPPSDGPGCSVARPSSSASSSSATSASTAPMLSSLPTPPTVTRGTSVLGAAAASAMHPAFSLASGLAAPTTPSTASVPSLLPATPAPFTVPNNKTSNNNGSSKVQLVMPILINPVFHFGGGQQLSSGTGSGSSSTEDAARQQASAVETAQAMVKQVGEMLASMLGSI